MIPSKSVADFCIDNLKLSTGLFLLKGPEPMP
jgi:hypothetical protein